MKGRPQGILSPFIHSFIGIKHLLNTVSEEDCSGGGRMGDRDGDMVKEEGLSGAAGPRARKTS